MPAHSQEMTTVIVVENRECTHEQQETTRFLTSNGGGAINRWKQVTVCKKGPGLTPRSPLLILHVIPVVHGDYREYQS
ncbi:MAG: hypothetical protein GY917_24815 [Planctomycetaceae bacterium]|nr:hypothetical protein [Planctomycetaceae bacterium]